VSPKIENDSEFYPNFDGLFFSHNTISTFVFPSSTFLFLLLYLAPFLTLFFPQIALFSFLNIYKIVVNLNIYKIEIEENLKIKN